MTIFKEMLSGVNAPRICWANEGGITNEFDPVVISITEISVVAQEHCATFGKNARLDNQVDGNKSSTTVLRACASPSNNAIYLRGKMVPPVRYGCILRRKEV